MGEKTVVSCPEIDQQIPVDLGKILQIDQSVLIVAWKVQVALERSADEALMVVRSGVEQVSKNFFFRPFTFGGTCRCVGIVQLHEQRLGLGYGAAEVGSDD